MNDYERSLAVALMAHQKNMENPDYVKAYKEMERRKREREKSEEALKKFGVNGACPPPEAGEKQKEKTAAEMRHDEIVKLFA